MKTRQPAYAALVAAIALGLGTPLMAADPTPMHLAQAAAGGADPSAGSNDKASSTPALVGRPDSVRSTTPDRDARATSPAGAAGMPGTASDADAMRDVHPGMNPGTSGFRHWWNEHARQHDGRVNRDDYSREMDRRWRAMDHGQGLTPAEIDRLHGWGPGVQPGASQTHDLGSRPEADNAQAR